MTKHQLLHEIAQNPQLAKLQEWVQDYLKQNAPADPAHAWDHFVRVAAMTVRLGDGAVPLQCAVAAAFFHDIVTVPKNSPLRNKASAMSEELALKTLPQFGFSNDEVQSIANAVRTHSYSRGEPPVDLLGKTLQDADRLEALGAIGLYRVIATGVKMGTDLFDVNDPWAEKGRKLDDKKYSVDHFFTKLLKLPLTMQTKAGRDEAGVRVKLLIDFLEQLGNELGDTLNPFQFERLLKEVV